jgi:peptidyl-tRNA hydrolase, PTH1 family
MNHGCIVTIHFNFLMQTFFPIQIIVGLGNPGREYELTRHNAGFILLDELARRFAGHWQMDKHYRAEVCKITVENTPIWLMKPHTFMNRSGHAVVPFMRFHRMVSESLLVLHDELDLLPGEVRVKQGGGNGGHNGLKDIQAQLGSGNFWRMRLGIGHPRTVQSQQPVADFVLTRPSKAQESAINLAYTECIKQLPTLVSGNQGENKPAFNHSIQSLHSLKTPLTLET